MLRADHNPQWLYASSVVYIPAAYVTKVTLLLLIARVFAVRRGVVLGLRIFIVVLLLAYLPIQLMKMAVCLPIRTYWLGEESVPGGSCLPQRSLFLSDLTLAIITDFIVLLVPVPLTWSLRVSRYKKMKIVALLGAGGAATAVTVYRMYTVVDFLNTADVTHDFAIIDLLTTVEISVGLICACFPSVNLLIERRLTSRRGRRLTGGSGSSPRHPRVPSSPRAVDSSFSDRMRKIRHDSAKLWQSTLGSTTTGTTLTNNTTATAVGTTDINTTGATSGAAAAGAGTEVAGETITTTTGSDTDEQGYLTPVFTLKHDDIELDVESQMASGLPVVIPPPPATSSPVPCKMTTAAAHHPHHHGYHGGGILATTSTTAPLHLPAAAAAAAWPFGAQQPLPPAAQQQAAAVTIPVPDDPPIIKTARLALDRHSYYQPASDRIWDGTGARPPWHRCNDP